jgi:hypothetical protein
MKRFFQIGISIIGIIAIGALSGLLINTNSELGQTRNSLSSASTSAAGTQSDLWATVGNLSAESTKLQGTKLAVDNENIKILQRNIILNTIVSCPWSNKKPDFKSNATISKDLLEWVGDRDDAKLNAKWELLYANSRSAIHKITGNFYWVFIVNFNDPAKDVHNSIFDVGNGCYMYLES